LIGRGVAYRKTEEADLSCVRNGVLLIGRSVAYRKTGLHGGTVHPPLTSTSLHGGTVHPPSTYSSLHRVLFIHRRPRPATTRYCSSTVNLLQPPRGPVHPPSTSSSHHGVLFIHPQPAAGVWWRTTARPPWAPVHLAPTAPTRPGFYSSKPPPAGVGRICTYE
jgi:hypothetical protein